MTATGKSELALYHGTSTLFLKGIREFGLGGQNILQKWRFYEFIRELAPLCEGHCDELDSYVFSKIVNQEVGGSNFQHGQVYLSPSKSVGARYAASNEYGSELVSEAMARVSVLAGRDLGVEDLLSRYKAVAAVLEGRYNPVLVTLPNAVRFKLLTERGGDAASRIAKVLGTFAREPERLDHLHQQDNFRLDSVVPIGDLVIESVCVTGSSASGFPEFEIGQVLL